MISNVRITFPKSGEALHQSYWQTVRRDKDGTMTAAAMGRSEDRLVKRNGKWLVHTALRVDDQPMPGIRFKFGRRLTLVLLQREV